MPKIIESLLQWPFISEIIIHDNAKTENIINYGRYTSAQKAANDLIYTQDDDWIVNNLNEVYEEARKNPLLITHTGIKDYENVIKDNIYGKSQMALAGWGMFFNKQMIPTLDEYTNIYGKDYCFYRETDRIFTMLMRQHHLFVPGNITELTDTRAPFALSQQSDHLDYKKLAIERSLKIINEN